MIKLFHNNLPIRATKTGGFSISLNEVNSESSTEFRDIDAVRKLVSLGTLMQFERSENYVPYSLRVLASLGTFLKKKQGILRGKSLLSTQQSIISNISKRI